MKNIPCFLLLFCALTQPAAATPSADIEKQIDALISKMTLQEKLGQLQMLYGDNGKATPEQLELARKGLLGAANNVRGAKNVNELQQAALESRLKIPLLTALDTMHGYRTIFPIPLGAAASFDPSLVERCAAITAREARASGVNFALAPSADITRDAKWGPYGDTFGEDPYLAAVMTRAAVMGLQGDDYSAPGKLPACVRSLAAGGGVEGGRDWYLVEASRRVLEELYFPPFKAAAGAGVACFMASNAILNGLPGPANDWLINAVLKKGWGFDGLVLANTDSLFYLTIAGLSKNDAEAAATALKAGVDVEAHSRYFNKHIPAMLENKRVSMEHINEAVRRVLRVKFRAGLLRATPLADAKAEAAVLALDQDKRETVYKAALESLVLLKNEQQTLPFPKSIKKLLVVGGLADDKTAQLGGWPADGRAKDTVTVLSALRAKMEKLGIELEYIPGTGLEPAPNDTLSEAASAAQSADAIVAVIGELVYEPGSRDAFGALLPTGMQPALVTALASLNKPMAVVLMSNRPLFLMPGHMVPAIMAAWFPGTLGGAAIADVLFADAQPSGKLPVSWPMFPGQVPVYYNHILTQMVPAYPFGHGLTYADFELSGLELSKRKISPEGSIVIGASLRNKSKVKADEVLQLYIQDTAASAPRPVKELKAFRRVTVGPGKTVKVKFTLGPRQLGFYDINGKFAVEPGEFKVWISTSSAGGLEGAFTVTP